MKNNNNGTCWFSGSALSFRQEGRGFDPVSRHVISRPEAQGTALCPAWHGSQSLWGVPSLR